MSEAAPARATAGSIATGIALPSFAAEMLH